MSGTVFYQSVCRGLQNPAGAHAITYFGTTFRIPRSDHATIRQLEWERPPDELCQPVTLNDGTLVHPDMSGIIERLETLDQETGDVIVTYRVPYHTGSRAF